MNRILSIWRRGNMKNYKKGVNGKKATSQKRLMRVKKKEMKFKKKKDNGLKSRIFYLPSLWIFTIQFSKLEVKERVFKYFATCQNT
jgi:hypothetical protein